MQYDEFTVFRRKSQKLIDIYNSYKIFIISKDVENENVEKMEVLTCSFGYYIIAT